MTGDDHGDRRNGGQFDCAKRASPAGCDVEDWECVRQTSYIYPSTAHLGDAQAAAYEAQGFEIALHVNTNCANWTPSSLDELLRTTARRSSRRIPEPRARRPPTGPTASRGATGRPSRRSSSTTASGSTRTTTTGRRWVQNRPGCFTGSGMPMRFADLDGSMIDVYQAATQMTDESRIRLPVHINTLLDNAIGAPGLLRRRHREHAHGHRESRGPAGDRQRRHRAGRAGRLGAADADLARRPERLVVRGPCLGRRRARVHDRRGAGANGLQAMVPTASAAGSLESLTRAGSPVAFTTQTIKGIEYAFFPATAGAYEATFAVDAQAPVISALNARPEPPAPPRSPGRPTSRRPRGSTTARPPAPSRRSWPTRLPRPATRAPHRPAPARRTTSGCRPRTAAATPQSRRSRRAPATFSTPATLPVHDLAPDGHAGGPSGQRQLPDRDRAKFRSDIAGFITGVRFYKGAANTGTHVGHLWTANGTLLAEATFNAETASGWQQVDFSTPSRSRPTPSTSPHTTRRAATSRTTPGSSPVPASTRRRSTPSKRESMGRTVCIGTARADSPPTGTRRTTGSMSPSRRRHRSRIRPRPPSRIGHPCPARPASRPRPMWP